MTCDGIGTRGSRTKVVHDHVHVADVGLDVVNDSLDAAWFDGVQQEPFGLSTLRFNFNDMRGWTR